jgi:hypothetical protein
LVSEEQKLAGKKEVAEMKQYEWHYDARQLVMADQLFLSKLIHKGVINTIPRPSNQELLVEVECVAGLLHRK